MSVPARSSDYNYRAIAEVSDGVVLMDYDEHYTGQGGSAGPIASQDWFTKNLEEAKKSIPSEKLICGIANYGYDWVQPPKRGKLPAGCRNTASLFPFKTHGWLRAIRRRTWTSMGTA